MTAYVTEKNNDDADHEHDAALLSLSNYIYNNQSGAVQSPHYAAILEAIKRIDRKETFLGVTGKFREIVSRSPALSVVSLATKIQLRNLMKDLKYGPEIAQDSKSVTASYFEEYEKDFVSNEKPLSSEDIRRSLDTDRTDEESVDSNSVASAEMEDMFQGDKKIVHESLDDVFNPSKETQQRDIRLLIRYIQAYKATPAAERSPESNYIITSVKFLCPKVLGKITHNIEADFIEKLSKSDVDNLYNIAGSNARVLNAFHDQTALAAQRNSSPLDPEITQIKALANYLNYALLDYSADQSEIAIFTPRAKYMMQMTQQISPKLKEVIIDANYKNKIDGVLATLSPGEKTQLITLASNNEKELSKTKDIMSRPSSPADESSESFHKK